MNAGWSLRAPLALVFISCFIATPAWSTPVCTLVIDANDGKTLAQQGLECETRTYPQSTFKIALAVIGYESGILKDEHEPTWPYKPEYDAWMESWKTNVDPVAWMRDSVVWYSREISRQLGPERLQQGINRLDYGNRDLSGDPGKNNGLTNAWLNSSLQISPREEAAFFGKLLNYQLPVSKPAIDRTLAITPQFPLSNGWTVHGKTGTGFQHNGNGAINRDRQLGWFVGWVQKGERKFVFAHLIKDDSKADSPAGWRARDAMLATLPRLLASQ